MNYFLLARFLSGCAELTPSTRPHISWGVKLRSLDQGDPDVLLFAMPSSFCATYYDECIRCLASEVCLMDLENSHLMVVEAL